MVKQLKRKIHIQMLIYNQAYFILSNLLSKTQKSILINIK